MSSRPACEFHGGATLPRRKKVEGDAQRERKKTQLASILTCKKNDIKQFDRRRLAREGGRRDTRVRRFLRFMPKECMFAFENLATGRGCDLSLRRGASP